MCSMSSFSLPMLTLVTYMPVSSQNNLWQPFIGTIRDASLVTIFISHTFYPCQDHQWSHYHAHSGQRIISQHMHSLGTHAVQETEQSCCCQWKSTTASPPTYTWGSSPYTRESEPPQTGRLWCFSTDKNEAVIPHLPLKHHPSLAVCSNWHNAELS